METPTSFWGSHLDTALNNVPWLWEGYLAHGNVTLLTSQWKSGKTTLISILLARLQSGGLLADLPVAPAKAVVVSEETPDQWALRHQKLGFPHVLFFCQPFPGKPSLDDWLAFLVHLADLQEKHALGLLVLDTLATFLPGRNEALAASLMETLLPLKRLTRQGMAVLLVHHPRKGDPLPGQAARGSGALAAFADITLEMNWCAHPAEDDRRRRLLAFSRYPHTPRQKVIELNPEATDYLTRGDFHADDFSTNWDRLRLVLEDAPGKRTRAQILEDWPPDFPRPDDSTLWRWLNRAASLGLLLQEGSGRKADPFRYHLPGQEDKWRQNPLYNLWEKTESSRKLLAQQMNLPFDEPPKPRRR